MYFIVYRVTVEPVSLHSWSQLTMSAIPLPTLYLGDKEVSETWVSCCLSSGSRYYCASSRAVPEASSMSLPAEKPPTLVGWSVYLA